MWGFICITPQLHFPRKEMSYISPFIISLYLDFGSALAQELDDTNKVCII